MRCGPVSRAGPGLGPRGLAATGREAFFTGREPRGPFWRLVGGTGRISCSCERVRALFGKRKAVVKHILIVEDEPLAAFDNELRLEKLGYTVVATRDNVREALLDLERETVDLVLADIRLSGKRTGIDLAREAKAMGVPVLFATGSPPEQCASFALGSLPKPYTDRDLKAAIRAVDDILAGRTPKPPKGMILYEPA